MVLISKKMIILIKINTFRVVNPNMNLEQEKYNIHKKKVRNKSWELKNDNIFRLFKNNNFNIKINREKKSLNKSVDYKNNKKNNNQNSFNFNNNCNIYNNNIKAIRKNNYKFSNYLNNSMDKIRGRKHYCIIDHFF